MFGLMESIFSLLFGTFTKIDLSIELSHFRLAQVAKGLIALGVIATHAIACYVAIDIAWTQYIHKRVEKSPHKLLWEYVLRTSVVFTTCKT